MHETLPLLEITDFPALRRQQLTSLQVNLGYKCNQRCLHCHVAASPDRTEMMSEENMAMLVPAMRAQGVQVLDLTGGAPELHEGFRDLVVQARSQGIEVIDRCNLTVLFEPDQAGLASFLAEQGVTVVASLPCYSEANVDRQRGDGVFDKSIRGLQLLNQLGYGQADSGLVLNLVFNPLGPTLPPDQHALEMSYKQRLKDDFGIVFNDLFALANMPIQRFGSTLISKGQFQDYMQLLKDNYQAANLKHVMCRNLISVDWQGFLYDCDFNQQLGLSLGSKKPHIADLLYDNFQDDMIRVADHCFGCTAGQGSSCGGAL